MIEKKDTTISKDGLVLLRMNENPDDYDSIILRNIQDNSKIDVKGVMNSKDRLNLKINSPYVFDFFMDHNWLTPNKKFSSIEFSIDSKKNGSIISSNISNSNHHFQTFNMNGVIKHKKIIFPFNTEFKKSRREANTKLFGLPDSLKCD